MGVFIAAANMELELGDRVLETTQTTGTGTYSLDGVSVAGRQSFLNAIGNGNRTLYVAELGSSYEIGIGTVTSGAPVTVSRDFIWKSSNSNNAVNWAVGVKNIYCDAAALLLLQIQRPGQVLWAGTATGTANALVLTTDDFGNSYFDGMVVWWRKDAAANTGNVTVNVNGVDAIPLLKAIGEQIPAAEAAASAIMGAVYLSAIDSFVVISGLTPLPSIVLHASQTATGTAINFTGLRSDAIEITVNLNQVSLSGTDQVLIQLGTSGGIISTGYISGSLFFDDSADTFAGATSTTGFIIAGAGSGANITGHIILSHLGSDLWVSSSALSSRGLGNNMVMNGGSVDTGAEVTQLRVTRSGTNTFTGGTISIQVKYLP